MATAPTQNYTYPGVYLNEGQAITYQVTPATTNVLAVVGAFPRGPVDKAVQVTTWNEFESQFGGLDGAGEASYTMWQFFQNGGTSAFIVRVPAPLVYGAELSSAIELTSTDPDAQNWSAQLVASKETKGDLDLQLTFGSGDPVTIPSLPPATAAGLATAINAATTKVSAAAAESPTEPVAAGTAAFTVVGGDRAAEAPLGPLTLTATSPGSAMNGWTVGLQPAGSGAAPSKTAVTLTVTAPGAGGAPPTVQEVLPNLDIGNLGTLAQLITSKSGFVAATAGVPTPMAAATADLTGGMDPGPGGSGTPAIASLGSLSLMTRQPTAATGWTVTLAAPAAADADASASDADASASDADAQAAPTTLTYTLKGAPTPETFSVSTDPLQFAMQIAQQSKYLMPVARLGQGTDGTWDSTALTNAILTQLGSDPDSDGPPPTPDLDQIAPHFFNQLCIPDASWLGSTDQKTLLSTAHAFCEQRKAFLIVDAPPPSSATPAPLTAALAAGTTIDNVGKSFTQLQDLVGTWGSQFLGQTNFYGATYYPWLQIPDPANNYLLRAVPPSGTVAGIYAATDASRGVWKAPAGISAVLGNVVSLADTTISDQINGDLNVVGINCMRTFPSYQPVVWGSRTLAGNDLYATVFKYVPARRLANYIELSMQQSLKWAVFEPNGPPLWASIVAELLPFMTGLYAAGAFEGASAAQAFSVACDATTTTPDDMERGVVNIQVGFQPVPPAEFVVLNVTVGALPTAAS